MNNRAEQRKAKQYLLDTLFIIHHQSEANKLLNHSWFHKSIKKVKPKYSIIVKSTTYNLGELQMQRALLLKCIKLLEFHFKQKFCCV